MDVSVPFNESVGQNFHLVRAIDTAIIDQLIGNKADKVHPVEKTRKGFINDRVGNGMQTHQTWVRTDADGQVEAALYTARFNKAIVTEADFHGDVADILTRSPSEAKGQGNPSFIFYSISSFKRGAGEALIGAVRGEMETSSHHMTASTLSPLRVGGSKPAEERNFTDWVRANITTDIDEIRNDTNFLQGLALRYLSENINPVQKFHMGNGAYIGDVNLNANIKGSADYEDGMNVMVNYVYPREQKRAQLQGQYQSGKLMIADHLLLSGVSFGQGSAYQFRRFTP